MTFYFAWVDDGEAFSPLIHARQDVSIFSFEISAKEGQVPWARVRAQNPKQGLASFEKQWAYLSWKKPSGEIEILFYGQLLCVGQRLEGESIELSLCARASNHESQLNALCQELKKDPLWHHAFVSGDQAPTASEVLESRTALFYWDRCTGNVGLSDLFCGRSKLDLGEHFFADTLDVRLKEIPLRGVQICLKTSWVQSYEGVSDLTTLIRSRFPGGMVNTLTGEHLSSKWWRTGEKIGRSGYWVDHSALQEIPPLHTGPLDLYPAYSSKVWLSPHDPLSKEPVPKQIRFKRKWYKMKLILGWRYKQKRTEKVDIFLEQKTQPLGATQGKVRTLTIPIYGFEHAHVTAVWEPNVRYTPGFRLTYGGGVYECAHRHTSGNAFDAGEEQHWVRIGSKDARNQAPQASFFTRQEGHAAIAHALEIGKAHLAASCRAVEITLTSSLEALSSVSCDHHIELTDPRLPGGRARGKVTSYRLTADGGRGIFRCEVTLGCAVGPRENVSLVTDTAVQATDLGTGIWRTPSGLKFQGVSAQMPRLGIVNPQGLSAIDLVEDVRIEGLPSDQNAHILENQYPARHNLKSALMEVKTEISIKLKDLRAMQNLEHWIHVEGVSPWSGPCHIDLCAPKES